MSNPFDQFATDLNAAMPPGGAPSYRAPPQGQPGMGSPPMSQQQPSGMGYGAPAPSPYGTPQQQPPPQQSYDYSQQSPFGGAPQPAPVGGGYGYGQPPGTPGTPGTAPGIPPSSSYGYGQPQTTSGNAGPPGTPGFGGAADPSNPFGGPTPGAGGQQPTPQSSQVDPWGTPTQAPPPTQQPPQYGASPYGAQQQQQPPPDPSLGALVPAQQQSNPYAQYAPPPQQYGQPGGYGQYGQPPPQPAAVDPFSVFESQPKPPAPGPPMQQQMPPPDPMAGALVPQQQQPGPPNPAAASDEDFWGSFAATMSPTPAPTPAVTRSQPSLDGKDPGAGQEGLPEGGEYYDARIFTPTLGVMFFKPQELTDSLFLNTEKSLVDSLEERPVVAFIVEGSSARSAGVELGHVLLQVNGVDVKNPKDASRLIKEGPRPLPLLFYVPNTEVVVAEGEHMVKYDTRDTTAPNSAKDWKPKYVVIGGIIAQPWMICMYRSKSEYDIAVIETQARRPVSVKVKQFSLQGARIQNDWQGPQMVKYKNKLHPWKYIVVLPVARNPIKISSPNLAQLKPVHEGIRRVLLAQQRDRGGSRPVNNPAPAPAPSGGGDAYERSQNGYPPNQQQQASPPQQQQQQMQPYAGPPPSYGGMPPQQPGYGQGYPPQGYPPQGYPPQGPPQGYAQQAPTQQPGYRY